MLRLLGIAHDTRNEKSRYGPHRSRLGDSLVRHVCPGMAGSAAVSAASPPTGGTREWTGVPLVDVSNGVREVLLIPDVPVLAFPVPERPGSTQETVCRVRGMGLSAMKHLRQARLAHVNEGQTVEMVRPDFVVGEV